MKLRFELNFSRIFGFYGFLGKYTIVVKDPVMLKQIMIKDFDHFVNRDPFEHSEADKYLSKSLLLSRGEKWKDMRSIVSPMFTSLKMKFMFGLLTEAVEDFINFYEEKALEKGGEIVLNTHEVFSRITADGISTTALGFKGDCVRNKDSEIYVVAKNLEDDFTNQNNFLLQFFPKVYKFLGLQICRQSVHDFFEFNVLAEIQRRQSKNIARPDLIELLIQAKNGKLKAEKGDETELSYVKSEVKTILKWTDDDLVAQTVVLFLGGECWAFDFSLQSIYIQFLRKGFETTAILMQALSWELAFNHDVQNKLTDEIDGMMEMLSGRKISYEELNSMKYLDMVVSEALRKWPSFRVTSRECTKDYVMNDGETGKTYKIPEGAEILIPIGAIQNDPKLFPNPEKFDPMRFSSDNKSSVETGSFISFGLGPRMCIGSRYAIMQSKLLLFHILAKFSFTKANQTPDKLVLASGLTGFKHEFYVNLKTRM